jgi:NAD+ diphosphatase
VSPRFESIVEPPASELGRCVWLAWRGRELLVTESVEIKALAGLHELGLTPLATHYLGRLDELHCFCAELGPNTPPPPGFRFQDLRSLLVHFEDWLFALCGRAVQIVEWDRLHRFCGACAAPTETVTGERARRCSSCGQLYYPRIAPAMIVAVEKGDAILLGRSKQFPPGIYSVLAGFVEPGESLEDAVIREVREEAGIEVGDVRYFASQPWPFPNSLMLGFRATWKSGEIHVDGVELETADWFPYDDLPKLFPGNVSISQWLISDFIARKRRGE